MHEKVQKDECWLYASTVLRGSRALAFGVAALASSAQANPVGGTLSAGTATISGQGTPVVQVNQSSDRAVIDWKSFNIAPGETTTFHQPSASSAILNRIHDQNPSQILGSLSANGIVALVNPNGMVFGQGSRVDVGSLIATSSNISNERFMNDRWLRFDGPGEAEAAIVNQGSISVREGGLAALVAPQVTNAGLITAKAGRVALGAGEIFTLDLYGDGLVSLAVTDRLREATVTQQGGIRAEGGTVLLTTAEARRVMDQAVNMDGWVDVSSVTQEAGSIVLHAAQGTANVNGKLHADGAVGTGGKLQVTGQQVKVGAGAVLTAIGTYGGGDIKIGGDYQGGGTTPHAKTARIEAGATLDASATARGQGGRVIAWSDERTEFGGLIYARGGLLGGDGGFVETSSKERLAAHGLVDASSAHGQGGEWLLDPSNVTIANGAGFNASGGGTVNPATDTYAVDATTIQTALNGGTSVTVTTVNAGGTQVGDITVNNATINKTAGGDATLTLKADRNIVMTGSTISSSSNELNVTLWSDADNGSNGAISLTNSTITSNGGDIILGGGTNPTSDDAVGDAAHVDGISLDNTTLNAGGGDIALRGTGWSDVTVAFEGGIYLNDSSLQTTNGTITLIGTSGDTGAGWGAGENIYGSNIQTTGGDIVITGTGGDTGGVEWSPGANIWDSNIQTTSGDITITGTGGDSGGHGGAVGIYTSGNWDGVHFTTITTGSGNIALNGTGGTDGGGWDVGVGVDADTIITATGTGNITITGIGGNSADGGSIGNSNAGVWISLDGGTTTSVTVNSGTLSINGTGNGAGDYNAGIALIGGVVLDSTGSGAIALMGQGVNNSPDIATNNDLDPNPNTIGSGATTGAITLTGNTMDLVNLAVQTDGDIALRPRTAATTIGLGGAAGTLNLTDAELGFFDAGGLLTIGRADGTGAMTLDAYNGWASPVRFLTDPTGSIIVNGAQGVTAASDAAFLFSGPVTLNAYLTTSAATGGTRDIDFDAAVTLGADVHISAGAGDVTFDDAVDGAHDFEITTTGDVTFGDDVGSVTPLGDVIIDPHDFIAGGSFHAATFTLTGGTGLVDFSAGTGLTTTGDISIETNDDILGTYTGTNGVLDAGAGSINATVSFGTLDVSGAAATLLAGYIGAPGAVTQTMANLIAIGGQRYPWPAGIPNDDFTFAGLYIGGSSGGAAGGSQPGGGVTPGPVSPPSNPLPSVPTPSAPQTPPAAENRNVSIFSALLAPSRVQRSALEMTGMYLKPKTIPEFRRNPYAQLITYSPELSTLLGCNQGDKNCYGDETP
jgi:filamentous hemagglutinin family protein